MEAQNTETVLRWSVVLTGMQRLVLANRLNSERIKSRGEDYRLRVSLWQRIRLSQEESERLGLELNMLDAKEIKSNAYSRTVGLLPAEVKLLKTLLDRAVETEGLTPAESEWFDPLYAALEEARNYMLANGIGE